MGKPRRRTAGRLGGAGQALGPPDPSPRLDAQRPRALQRLTPVRGRTAVSRGGIARGVSLGRWHAAPVLLTLALALLANGLATAGELTELPRPIPAPALELEDLAGRVHRLEDYRGQVVLVNFWATWCPPCVAELPGMRRLAERMAERPFALLAVNAGEGKGRIYKFLGVIGRVEFPVLLDGSRRAYDRWEVQVLPTSYLVDPQGSVRYRVVGAAEWDGSEALEAIEGLLTEQQDALRPVGR